MSAYQKKEIIRMRSMLMTLTAAMIFTCLASGAIKTQKIEYKAGDKNMVGYVAWDDSTDAKRPAVLVFPEWWGITDYAHKRAEMLAGLGYVGFAVDMYGEGKTTDDPAQAGQWAGEVKNNIPVGLARAQAALDTLKTQPMVDPDKIAAIGYCFGGSCVLEMARHNMPVKGVVSFHGDLTTASPAKSVAPRVLVCTGAVDSFVPIEQVGNFEKEMKNAGAKYDVIVYENAHHSFTNPDADRHHIPNIQYDEKADKQSWEAMQKFLAELFK